MLAITTESNSKSLSNSQKTLSLNDCVYYIRRELFCNNALEPIDVCIFFLKMLAAHKEKHEH